VQLGVVSGAGTRPRLPGVGRDLGLKKNQTGMGVRRGPTSCVGVASGGTGWLSASKSRALPWTTSQLAALRAWRKAVQAGPRRPGKRPTDRRERAPRPQPVSTHDQLRAAQTLQGPPTSRSAGAASPRDPALPSDDFQARCPGNRDQTATAGRKTDQSAFSPGPSTSQVGQLAGRCWR